MASSKRFSTAASIPSATAWSIAAGEAPKPARRRVRGLAPVEWVGRTGNQRSEHLGGHDRAISQEAMTNGSPLPSPPVYAQTSGNEQHGPSVLRRGVSNPGPIRDAMAVANQRRTLRISRGLSWRFKQSQIGIVSIAAVPLVAGDLAEQPTLDELCDVLLGGRVGASQVNLDHPDRKDRLLEQVIQQSGVLDGQAVLLAQRQDGPCRGRRRMADLVHSPEEELDPALPIPLSTDRHQAIVVFDPLLQV